LRREPAHYCRGIGGKKIVAGRGEIDASEIRRIEPHAVDAMHQFRRQAIEQRNLIDSVFHNDSCGVKFLAGIGLSFQYRDAHSSAREHGSTC
jgi:hypothetical protein